MTVGELLYKMKKEEKKQKREKGENALFWAIYFLWGGGG